MQFFKRMEIHGFKSFAHKTVIDFQPGITVVVGPNGCGKSNVFDSIRWVLGEQSARSLRGSRMGDVIFAGSGGLKQLGMARVELVLNNDKRTLPVDFDEVSVARRLFRTGESEYLLNRSQCRLKDVTGLFLDTGIGSDGYSVMEQGKVDAIINAKPLERRAIFDEAAGISKYKARKDEALSKLRRTEDDLLRLSDVINEVRLQAQRLKRQSSKAEKYKRLAAEQRELEMEFLVRRFFQYRSTGAASEAAHHELAQRVEQLKTELAQLQEQEAAGRSAADEVTGTLEASQSLHYEVNHELQEVQARIALLQQRTGDSGERRAALEKQVAENEAHALELEQGRAQLSAEIASQEQTLEQLRSDHARTREAFEVLKADGDVRVAEMARLRQEIQGAERERGDADNRARVARAMEEKQAEEAARGDSELQMLREQVDSLKAERDDRREEARTAEENKTLTAATLAAAKDAVWSKDQMASATSTELETARREAQVATSRHEALADLQESFEGYYRGVKEVMIAGKRGDVAGLVGVVSTLVEARKEHELAIEVALGSQAQDIIVETAEHGKRAIRWLKDARVGRATFLPLDLIEGRDTRHDLRSLAGEPGVIGLATELVKFNPRIRNVVQYLLGNVVVVRDLDVAVALERRGIRTKYVTLEGEMVSAAGAMTGGSVKASGLLNRTREVKELGQRVTELRKKENELAARAAALKSELAQLREARETAVREAQAAEIEAARTKKDAEVVEQRLNEKLSQLTKLEERRTGLVEELERHRQAQSENNARVEELTRVLADLSASLTAVEMSATAKQAEVADASRAVQELEVALATAVERVANLKERLGAGDRESVRLANLAAERRAEIQRIDEQVQEARSELEAVQGRVAELQERQKAINEQITLENQRREVVQLDLKKLGERQQLVQRDYNEAQNELHEAELRRTESKVQLETMATQASEKFGATLAEVIAKVLGVEPLTVTVEAEATEAAESVETSSADETGEPVENGAEAGEQPEAARLSYPDPLSYDADEFLAQLKDTDTITARLGEVRGDIDALGPVHVGAIDEYNEANTRFEFLTTQEKDLLDAKGQLADAIARIDSTTKDLFSKAFAEIRGNFEQVFRRLFGGGRADLLLTEESGVLDSGIDIIAQPPGKKPQHISLLSGGEKALTAVALLFAIFLRKPAPFCILDEIDAPLDDKNIERFKELVREFSKTTQFIIITHNKQTMALANTIYGVTMQEQGVSRVVSLKLDEISDDGEVLVTAGEEVAATA